MNKKGISLRGENKRKWECIKKEECKKFKKSVRRRVRKSVRGMRNKKSEHKNGWINKERENVRGMRNKKNEHKNGRINKEKTLEENTEQFVRVMKSQLTVSDGRREITQGKTDRHRQADKLRRQPNK